MKIVERGENFFWCRKLKRCKAIGYCERCQSSRYCKFKNEVALHFHKKRSKEVEENLETILESMFEEGEDNG